MGSSCGDFLKLTIFGQSHSPAIGMTLEGIPAGTRIDMKELGRFLERRAPGRNRYSTPRKESDIPEFLSGLVGDVTCGTPLTAIIRNNNTRSADYDEIRLKPRPGHADLTAQIKYKGFQDYTGGGHFSGRLTAPLCIAGGICRQMLKEKGVNVRARILSIADIEDHESFQASVEEKDFPVVSDKAAILMKERISEASNSLDSVGGIVECVIDNLPAGLGDPMFTGLENRIASVVFGIPAVKGIEFGAGFKVAKMRGSECNDAFDVKDGKVITISNNCGGILGGISNGMPVIFRAAFKPTPSIGMRQQTVDLGTMKSDEISVKGRHDPCIVPRAVPCVEAAAAFAVLDAWLDTGLY